MRRREFIAGLGSAAAWPRAARAQQQAMPVVGILFAGTPEANANQVAAFRKGLGEAGYVEGRNVAIEYRFAETQYGRLPALAADLVQRRVSAIYAAPDPSAVAAKAATATIPIVFSVNSDPVRLGLVASFNRPGGNLTGFYWLSDEVAAKRFDLLHKLVPSAALIAVLVNPVDAPLNLDLQGVSDTIGAKLVVVEAGTERELDTAFATMLDQRAGALFVAANTFFFNRRTQIVALAARHAIPSVYEGNEFAKVGGLMSYGTDLEDQRRQAGVYVGRILRGAKPADLPVVQPTKFDLVINLKTARALGLEIPPTLLAIADEVIE
jgi:putative ABC transport system substrate-binding protein